MAVVFRNLMSSQTSSSLNSEAGVGRAAASHQTQAADRGNLVLRRRRRRRRKFPKQKLFKHPRPGGQKIHFTKKVGPYKLWDNDLNYNDFDDRCDLFHSDSLMSVKKVVNKEFKCQHSNVMSSFHAHGGKNSSLCY